MTEPIHFTPDAELHRQALDDWIAQYADGDTASRVAGRILDHIDSILAFPHAGRARDDIRPGMRTTAQKKRTLVAYEIDEQSDELGVNILGAFATSQITMDGGAPDLAGMQKRRRTCGRPSRGLRTSRPDGD